MKKLDISHVNDVVLSVKTTDDRIDYVRGVSVTSAGFVRERCDKGYRWVLVLNYQSPFYTKVYDLDEAVQVIRELFGDEAWAEANEFVSKHTKKAAGL